MSIRTTIARWLAPGLTAAEISNHRLISEMQDAYWWLGEFPDAQDTLRFLLDGYHNRNRAIGEPAIGNLPGDISGFREHLRRRALENSPASLADAPQKPHPRQESGHG